MDQILPCNIFIIHQIGKHPRDNAKISIILIMPRGISRFGITLSLILIAFAAGVLYRDGLQLPDPTEEVIPTATITPSRVPTPKPVVHFTGPQLFDAVNQKRREYGVNPLGHNDDLCSLASFRLNQLLPANSLDNHKGFVDLANDPNSPFAWLFDKYNIAEFLVLIPDGPAQDAVAAWDDTLGHRILLNGGQYTIGCTYAQRGIGVALAGY